MRCRQIPVAALAASLLLGVGASCAHAAGVFTLSSTTFADGQMMPKKVANSRANRPDNPGCVGDNVAPQLSWTNTPEGAKSLALILTDPQGGAGRGFVHFVAYGVPASVSGFAEGELSKPSDKYVAGKNGAGQDAYFGPCPASGTSTHHYVFVLIATDFDQGALPPGLTRDELFSNFGNPPTHVKGTSSLVGLFVNP